MTLVDFWSRGPTSVPRFADSHSARTPTRSRLIQAGAVLLAVLIVGGPAIFTQNGFASDFTNHLWLVWIQEHAISGHLAPTYFVNASPLGVFYPFFIFYGGTLYAAAGALAVLLGGHVEIAYVGVVLISIAVAYSGWLWLARQLGVRSWMAHAPAIAFVSSAYYVTNLYGRGAWPEFVATSTIPMLLASGYRLTQGPRIEPLPATIFVVTAVFAAGSHNPTLIVGGLWGVGAVILLWPALGVKVTRGNGLRLAHIGALGVLAVAIDAWFLLPDVLYGSKTVIGSAAVVPWSATSFFNTPGMLFDPLRAVPHQSSTPALYVQVPDWFLAWALVAIAALWRRGDRRVKRSACAIVLLLGALLALIMIGPLYDAMPRSVLQVQFPYRFDTDVTLCVSALVLAGVLSLEHTDRPRGALQLALLSAGAISVGLCLWQLWVPNTHHPKSYSDRSSALVSMHLAPRTWYDTGAYFDTSQPVVPVARAVMSIDPATVDSDHATLTVRPPAGDLPFATDIGAGPYVVKLGGGLTRAGRMPLGQTAARRTGGANTGPVKITLSPTGAGLAIGRIITRAAIILSLVLLVRAMIGIRMRRALDRGAPTGSSAAGST